MQHGPVLVVPLQRQHRVEGGPEHPEEQGAHGGQDVRLVAGALLGVAFVQPGPVQRPGDAQAEVAGEHVDQDASAGVVDLQVGQHGPLGDGVHRDLQQGHDQQLQGAGLPQHGAEGDQDGGAGELRVDEVDHPQVDLAVVAELEVALHQDGPLYGEGGGEEVEHHAPEAVLSEESQEAAETEEYHHLDVGEERIVFVQGVVHGDGSVALQFGVGLIIVGDI